MYVLPVGRAVVTFRSYKPTGSTNQPEVQTNRKYKPTGSTNQPEAQMYVIKLASTMTVKKEIFIIINKKRSKTKLYMYKTKGDVALINISQEKNYFHELVQYPK